MKLTVYSLPLQQKQKYRIVKNIKPDIVVIFSQAMESKLLVGGKNIIDHTNEQQKMLEMKRQEIAEQVKSLCFCVYL